MTLVFDRLHVRFSPSLWPTLAAIATAALTLYLGHWQQGRAQDKRALQAQYLARAGMQAVTISGETRDPALQYRHAMAAGEWLPAHQLYVDNKVSHEVAGYHVITPLKIRGSETVVLVNRGWIARGPRYPAAPQVPAPAGQVRVAGLLAIPSHRFLELSSQAVQGDVWQNMTVERFRQATGLDALPFVLLAQDATPGLEPVSEIPDAGVDKHVEYMLTWYSLSATVVVLWLAMNVKRNAERPES